MAFSITDLKKGTVFQLDGHPYRVLEYAQKVVGRGGSIVNVKIKSLVDGRVLEKTFKGNERLEQADVSNGNAQFLYADNDQCFFMDNKTFETHAVSKDIVGAAVAYMKEGLEVLIQSFEGRVIGVEPPKNVFLKVIYTENAVKGDTSSSITKEAKLETGAVARVPAFIKQGDIISVDTTTGIYRERKKD